MSERINGSLRKFATAAVVATTISWSIGLSAFVAPLAASAASSGSLVKGSLSAVYYVGSDGKRYVFPNEKTYKTWYSDFSTVQTITDAELASLAIGGNVTYRPGAKLVKITSDPKVYAVDSHGVLRWVKSEAAAIALYGANWNHGSVEDVSDAFFTNYTSGADINSASDFSPSTAMANASSIGADKGMAVTVSGTVSVKLAATNPGPVTVVGGVGTTMLDFDVTNNGTSAVTVDSLTVHRSGTGPVADMAGVYIYDGYQRLTSLRSINVSSNDAVINGLHIDLAAGQSKTVTVSGSFNFSVAGGGTLTGSNQHALTLTDLRVGTTQASGLPLTGATVTTAGTDAGYVTVTKSSTLSDIKSGGLQQEIGEFTVANSGKEDMNFYGIAPTLGGSIGRDKVMNLTLKQAGVTLATAPGYDSYDRASLFMTAPLLIERGSSKVFAVYADISPATRADETLFTFFDDAADVLVYGGTYGFGSTALTMSGFGGSYDGTSCALGTGDCSSTKVDAGQLTISFNGPASHDIATNGKDQELLNFTMAAGSNLEVRSTQIKIDSAGGNLGDGTNAFLSDVKLTDTATGSIVAGPKDIIVAATTSTLTFTETYELSAGQSRTFKLTGDVSNSAPYTSLKATLIAFGNSAIRNLDTSTNISSSDIVPSSDIAGNTDNVKAPSIVLSGASTPVAQTYIKGSQDVALAGISLKAGDASDVRVNTLAIQGQIDTNDGTGTCTVSPDGTFANGRENAGCSSVADVVQTVKLWNGTTQVSTTKSPSSNATAGQGGLITFDNMNLVIPKGQTLTLTLSGSLSSALLTANLPDRVKFNVASSGVTATDPDGNSITASGSSTGSIMTVSDTGAITVAVAPDDTESEAGIVVGSSSNTVLAKYKFTAQNEELKLTKTRIALVTGGNSTAISSVSLFDGSTLVGGPASVDGSGVADFSGMNFVIPKDGTKVLTVKANLNSVGASGAATGLDLEVQISAAGSAFEVRGTSAGSSTTLTTFSGSPLNANSKIIRKSKPTITLVSLPSTALAAGDQVVQRFTVSADAAGDVSFAGLSLLINNGTGGAITAITGTSAVRRVGDGADLAGSNIMTNDVGAGGTPAYASCATTKICKIDVRLQNEEVVAAGTSRTYDVRLTVASAVSGNSVSSKILGDTGTLTGALTDATVAAGAAGKAFKVNGTDSAFAWSDLSLVPHTFAYSSFPTGVSSSADWANGAFVKVLPTDTQSLTK